MKYLLTFILSVFYFGTLLAQCPKGNASFSQYNMTPSNVGDSVLNNAIWGGEYVKVDVTNGHTYMLSTCDSPPSYDAFMTVFDASDNSVEGTNDDFCGDDPYILYTATFDGTIYVQLNGPGCSYNTNNTHLKVKYVSGAVVCADPDMPTIAADTICSGSSTSLSVSSGNLNDATAWHWYTASCGGTSIGTGTSMTVSPNSTTTYYVRGEGGCITAGSCKAVTVVVNSVSASTFVDSMVSCNGYTDGGATASATGGTNPYTYAWSNASTTASITGVVAGTYTVTITDANGCTDTAQVTLSEPAILVASATVNQIINCNDETQGQVIASASGGTAPYTYLWNTGGTAALETALGGGSYNVTITDANGCTDVAQVTLSEPAILVAATSVDNNVTCYWNTDGGATASATGGTTPYTYAWNTGDTEVSITGLATGTYSVTITDANGCTDTESVTINLTNALEDASFNYDASGYCAEDSDPNPTITGTSEGYFNSSPSGLSLNTSSGQIDLSESTPGTYSVTYTTPNEACPVDSTVTVIVYAEDDPSFSYPISSYCLTFADPTPVIDGTSGGIFTASPAGLELDSLTGQIDLSASIDGEFVIRYTTQGNCPHFAQETLTLINDTTDVFIEVYQSGLRTTDNPDLNYRWLNCDGYSELPGETDAILVLDTSQSGSYAVEVSKPGCIDTSACVEINFYTITQHFDTLTAPSYYKPVPDKFHVGFAEIKEHVEYQLLNSYGVVLYESESFNIDGIQLDMGPYEQGEYFLDVILGKYKFRVRIYR